MNKMDKNIFRMRNLDNKTGEKYCWSVLVDIAVQHSGEKRADADEIFDNKDSARNVSTCKKEGQEIGRCWCGKFIGDD